MYPLILVRSRYYNPGTVAALTFTFAVTKMRAVAYRARAVTTLKLWTVYATKQRARTWASTRASTRAAAVNLRTVTTRVRTTTPLLKLRTFITAMVSRTFTTKVC